MDYKDTLNMPNTDFEMRGNLAQKEPGILKNWQQDNYYQSLLKHHKGQKAFILHDGPPYANGNLHAGTAMNRTIKDFIIRSHAMSGYYTPFFPGWDTHGLPIENAIQKLGVDRKALSAAEFRRKCEEYAHQQIAQQMETEKRLGQIADYEHPYITLKKEFEARQIQSFATMALNGMIFQGLKPVYWSPYNETAVADSEIIYKDVKDATIYLKFPIADGKGVLGADDNFVIWTTTPWTIPSNMAVSVHPDLEYALVKTSAGNLIVLAKFVDRLLEKFNLENLGILKTFTGKEIEGATYHHVVLDKECPCLLGTHVTDEDGTGVVHTAGGHGMDDYLVCMKNGMPPICTVDERGYMNAEAGSYQGMFFEDCSKAIIHDMSEKGYLLQVENITHSYPHDDRLKKKVIFRAVKQWFCSIERVREKALDEINNHVKWHNSFGQKRMNNMIADRGDWCISRQRLWGVPIPIIYCEDNSPIMEKEVFDHIAELMNEYGSNVWFEREAKDLLPEGYTNEKSPNGEFRKETDIMDVWFDSGSSWNELIARGDGYPCDLYFEGSDQYRGWFNSSLIVSTAVNGTAPYKEVLSHGYVVDSKGEKMSKSVGNVVNPMDIINQNGADVFRLWAMSSDFKEDLKLGPSNIKQVSDQYRKIRNTFRFLLGNVNGEDFNPSTDMVAFEDLERVDQQVLVLLNDLVADVRKDVLEYNYLSANKHLMYFMVNILSSYYCDFTKDILYVSAKGDHRRRQVQSVYWNCADALVKLWAPFLAFTAEEIWTHFSHLGANSVHYEEFPEVKEYAEAEILRDEIKRLLEVRALVTKANEEARNEKLIASSQEAKILLTLPKEEKELVEKNLGAAVAQWLIVSQVELVEGETAVKVEKASGQKCPRCWNYDEHVDENGLCPRCHAVMEGYKLIHQN
ncbi:isoleucine--tRNA ligase [Solobacterium moorei]|uniref:isoleucine--tRNA ligase n=1 Tax=Solobacterium moorei TaxID=102148 RepID=UPI0004091264|nr:isoleucine--tRNA ligase [Solobacterium moorei]BET21175.1 isoleucine--tRNA ligase [Solobacterium moorei]